MGSMDIYAVIILSTGTRLVGPYFLCWPLGKTGSSSVRGGKKWWINYLAVGCTWRVRGKRWDKQWCKNENWEISNGWSFVTLDIDSTGLERKSNMSRVNSRNFGTWRACVLSGALIISFAVAVNTKHVWFAVTLVTMTLCAVDMYSDKKPVRTELLSRRCHVEKSQEFVTTLVITPSNSHLT